VKAILSYILIPALLALTASAGSASFAYAGDDDDDDDDQSQLNDGRGPVVHPTLELYGNDATDPCVAGSQQIRITVNGINKEGILKFELYSGDDDFLKGKGRLRSLRIPAENAPQIACINVPEPGAYAVASYHDRDGNRKLKKKWNFTPREPYGLSNNPEFGELRMPKFSEAAFDVPVNGADIVLNLVDLKALKKQKKRDKEAADKDGDDED